MPPVLELRSLAIVESLGTGSIRGALVIALAWLVCRHVRTLAVEGQAAIWWLASFALLVTLLPLPAIPLPILPAAPAVLAEHPLPVADAGAASARSSTTTAPAPGDPYAGVPPVEATQEATAAAATRPVSWVVALTAVWALGVVFTLVHLLASWARLRRVIARSTVPDAAVAEAAARLSIDLGLTRVPPVRTSDEIVSPQLAGLWRPVVLLPPGASSWSALDLRMALCHELVHLRRRDLLWGWVPVIAARLFFFHPLAHLAAREYVIAREAACDAAVLRTLAVEPQQYGRLLVRIGVVRRQPALAASGAASSAQVLRRRLEMLIEHRPRRGTDPHRWVLAAAVCLAILPVRFVNAAAETADRDAGRPLAVQPSAVQDRPAPRPVAPVPPGTVQPAVVLNCTVALPPLQGMACEQDRPAPRPVTPVPPGTVQPAAVQEAPRVGTPVHPDAVQELPARGIEGGVPGGIPGDISGGVSGGVPGEMPGGVGGANPGQNRDAPVVPEGRDVMVSRQQQEVTPAPAVDARRWQLGVGYRIDPRGLPATTDAATLEQMVRLVEQQREALSRAQEDLALARETLLRQQEELARRQQELVEAQRVLVERMAEALRRRTSPAGGQ